MTNQQQFTAKQFIDVIPGTGGIISTIAKRAGCEWHTAKKYIDNHPTIHRAWLDEKELVLDVAESSLITLVKDGDFPAIKYYLSTQGKHRGYTERQETRNQTFTFDPANFSVIELEQIAAGADPLTVVANRLAATPPAGNTEPDITPDPDALDNE
jgi:hypothetical protein